MLKSMLGCSDQKNISDCEQWEWELGQGVGLLRHWVESRCCCLVRSTIYRDERISCVLTERLGYY